MSRVGNLAVTVNTLYNIPDAIDKFMSPFRVHDTQETKGDSGIPVDILDNPTEYVLYMDVPGVSKSDIQVTVEDEKTLVVRSSGKRKREEGCKYLRLERRKPQKLLRKFLLPENAKYQPSQPNARMGFWLWLLRSTLHLPKPKQLKSPLPEAYLYRFTEFDECNCI